MQNNKLSQITVYLNVLTAITQFNASISCAVFIVSVFVCVCVCVCVYFRLILEFDVRTKEESGLLLYMARINHADFVSIQVSITAEEIPPHCF